MAQSQCLASPLTVENRTRIHQIVWRKDKILQTYTLTEQELNPKDWLTINLHLLFKDIKIFTFFF